MISSLFSLDEIKQPEINSKIRQQQKQPAQEMQPEIKQPEINSKITHRDEIWHRDEHKTQLNSLII